MWRCGRRRALFWFMPGDPVPHGEEGVAAGWQAEVVGAAAACSVATLRTQTRKRAEL